ncbi:MAG: hypothetical protein CMN87_17030 [Stappia sp.]|uniref:hypothetical protein n=1 Tax=Stappia sp. TaxID=1870903 RepID=UPI000C3BE524|nr:hypothetical protein [Stappia sp.]MAA98393.1 hypothetical protein [Stappia sp.]MBM21710.1 hypothetical protein [Stappia sp.]
MMRHSLLGAAGLATTAGLLFQALPASADGLTALLSQLPGNVQALSRVPGPEGSGTGFYVVRETQGDRLFIGRSTSDGQDIDEVSEAGAIGGRVTGLRSESDELGVAAFVDMREADGEETTYELFLENENPAAYIFRPASN